jgi:predicted ATPase
MLSAFVCWLRSYPEQAVKRAQAALTLAQALSHSHTQGYALFWAAHLYQVRREVEMVQAHAEALISLTQEQGFTYGLTCGMIMRGWTLAEQDQVEEGIAQIHKGLAAVRALGVETGQSDFLAMLAEAHRKGGQIEEGLNVLAEALARVERTGECFYEAELYRLYGELTLQKAVSRKQKAVPNPQLLTPSTQAEAEECFLKAIDIARTQHAKMWELRATVSLARLWQQQGKRHEAQQRLADIYYWFTEGFDTVDLQEAKVLLEELV